MQREYLEKIVKIALEEDEVFNDVTSDLTMAQSNIVEFEISPREEIIFCGADIIFEVFMTLKSSPKFRNSHIDLQILAKDGKKLKAGEPIAKGFGDAKLVFAAERVTLNFIQHASGISTLTNKFVEKLNNKKIKILDTRKTLPGLRELEKYAVLQGGGKNHRFNLSDMILIKDNHIAAAGNIEKAIKAAKKTKKKIKIEVECDTVKQVAQAVKSKPDVIMLDNMKIADIKKSIALINGKTQIEISGGINLESVANFSKLKVDFISVGSLTHSARAVDIGLDIK